MAEVWVAALGAVAGAGATIYASNKQASATKSAASSALSAGFTPLKLPDYPKPHKLDPWKLEQDAVNFDAHAYMLSDKDFARRHQPLVDAEKLFEAQTLKDQQGENELMPALQNEYLRAGLKGALSSFGTSPGTLAPGSAGEADVARNLGLSIAGFQDRNRDNRQKSLLTAEELFPRRTFGFGGNEAVGMEISNTNLKNQYDQARHGEQVQLAQYNATGQANFQNAQQQQANVNSAASAQSGQANSQAIMSAVQMLAKIGSTYAGSRNATGAPYGNPSGAVPNYSGWKPGPQTGTYYVPS